MLSTAEEILKKPRYRRKENLDEWKSFWMVLYMMYDLEEEV
jgi:hypothetical protein